MPRLADLVFMALVVLVLVGSLLEQRDIRKARAVEVSARQRTV